MTINQLKKRRKKIGIHSKAVAAMLDISPSIFSLVEHGKHKPESGMIQRYHALLSKIEGAIADINAEAATK